MIINVTAALSVLLFMGGPSLAANNPEGYFVENEHRFAQDVSGEGYAMVYQKVNTETLQLQNYMHGSGSMDSATLINSSQAEKSYYKFDPDTGRYASSKTKVKQGTISFVEQNEMDYAPQSFAYGTGYYAKNPVVFDSKLKEKTCGKSYQEGVSMHHQIEYAQGFGKDIRVNLECIESNEEGVKGHGLAEMGIEETVIEGTVHVGELLTNPEGSRGWKDPLIEIDENYVGTFAIKKNMKLCAEKSKPKAPKDWLSCCVGGYGEMEDDDKIWGEEEIFDCTCRDVAWGDSWSDKSNEQSL
ncbi:MAG TPA: hypothetical protein HA349_06665 [Methanotrichaceae archaeon]|nr:hypothetical protein [Methanotrichaceae archaeon]